MTRRDKYAKMPASKLTTVAAAAAARVDAAAAALAAAVAASSSSTFGGIVLALSRHCARGGLVRCLSVFFAGCLAVSLAYSIYTFPLLIPLPLAVPLPLSPLPCYHSQSCLPCLRCLLPLAEILGFYILGRQQQQLQQQQQRQQGRTAGRTAPSTRALILCSGTYTRADTHIDT